ncbi:SDR family NAD(P)-dependent oxidoreductase [Streptomyces violarus]|uniref:SDR family NAD(P)-dependent oxidoreductase n=1 Tax=Streptomyces violarus TaxID=67380 RepID=UPI0021C20905|nr:SDR family NAD(P)-dependent oxidoreductase [Streptomyces violarus]MCT9139770.1 SDR family NAD(P)-dependent oxidoreductase [Streptomyces violarus]
MNGIHTILVTGATDGLGRALSLRLATERAHLILHGRNAQKLKEVAASVEALGGWRVSTLQADFSELAQVRRMAQKVEGLVSRLDVLVNNAGIGFGRPEGPERKTSRDGIELRFAVNYLAGFLLTDELTPLMRRTGRARVVNISSLGQREIDFENLLLEYDYTGIRAYCQSKLAQIMMAMEFARRVPCREVTCNSVHPATYMPTKIVIDELGMHQDSLGDGVASTYRMICDTNLKNVTGEFFNGFERGRADPQAYDETARVRLWDYSRELIASVEGARDHWPSL